MPLALGSRRGPPSLFPSALLQGQEKAMVCTCNGKHTLLRAQNILRDSEKGRSESIATSSLRS